MQYKFIETQVCNAHLGYVTRRRCLTAWTSSSKHNQGLLFTCETLDARPAAFLSQSQSTFKARRSLLSLRRIFLWLLCNHLANIYEILMKYLDEK